MSQEKIDRYKQEKANRKKNLKKQRTMNLVRKGVLTLVGWLGYSAYDSFSQNKNREITTVDYGAIDSYLIDLQE